MDRKLLSTAEQIEKLQVVAGKVMAATCNCLTVAMPGDVVMLCAANVDKPSEIIYAVDGEDCGGYDVWRKEKPVKLGITADEAADIVIAEYRRAKKKRAH